MAGDPEELRGLHELHGALLARRKMLAIRVAAERDDHRQRGIFVEEEGWMAAAAIIDLDGQARAVAAIISRLEGPSSTP